MSKSLTELAERNARRAPNLYRMLTMMEGSGPAAIKNAGEIQTVTWVPELLLVFHSPQGDEE